MWDVTLLLVLRFNPLLMKASGEHDNAILLRGDVRLVDDAVRQIGRATASKEICKRSRDGGDDDGRPKCEANV
jgi:hypothetical protein